MVSRVTNKLQAAKHRLEPKMPIEKQTNPSDPFERNRTMVDLNQRNFINGPLAYQSKPQDWTQDQIQLLAEQEQMFNLSAVAEEDTRILASHPQVGRSGNISGGLMGKRNHDGLTGRGAVASRGRRPKNVKTR
jgi:hypothetical protein